MQIDKGVPFPAPRNAYPFGEMDVGDSFAFGTDRLPTLRTALNRYKKANPDKDFTARMVIEGGESKARIWRTK